MIIAPSSRLARLGIVAALACALVACETVEDLYLGEETETPLKGERIAVMLEDAGIKADPTLANLPVELPAPQRNASWQQAGGEADQSNGHLAVSETLEEAWSISIGAGGDGKSALLAPPVVAEGRIFTIDGEAVVRAFAVADGRELWQFEARPEDEEEASFQGGVAVHEGKVFVATGYAEMIALSSETGQLVWRESLPGPARGLPAVSDARVYAATLDNRLLAFSSETGEKVWEHRGADQISAILGGASPAIDAATVLVPYSSGELFALRVENGRPSWYENLSAGRQLNSLSRLSDIRANPVIEGGIAYAVSNSRRMVAIDLRSGARIWEKRIGSVHMPWAAGNFVFVTALEGEVAALARGNGGVRWVQNLPPFQDMEDKRGAIQYTGPVLAGDRLLVGASTGELFSISPYTGELLGSMDLGNAIYISPIVADETVFVLTDDGRLHALR